ncbi:alpha/beta fold hydrolase [Streptomyces liangshanensis]|uniref:Alpha/beta hydrolase n=1 Tax=Streptomyces liangshanensis TaxID=2717324 RepID=A0A6G9GX67_9ACTN|nr:alpha/beta hydrolase [Streptomyces liangshanensis]QIQ02815.1 alpha/beta hydrolase [Streptomyces liangshanensis]
MSRPPTWTPPPCARATPLRTRRGRFAALDARPAGRAQGTALLVPGFTGSKEDFIALLEPLTQAGYRVVAVDGRGQYETEGPDTEEAYTQGELAADILAQAEALDATGTDGTPVHLLGHSFGGHLARAAVLLDRAPFRSLTLLSSGPAEVAPAQREKLKLLRDALSTMTMEEVWAAMQAMDAPAEETPTDGAELRHRWLRTHPAQLIAAGRQLASEPDRVAELAAVQPLPKHVMSGERDDTWPVAWLDSMATRLGARRTVITGAEHSPNTDRPDATAKALADFWDEAY